MDPELPDDLMPAPGHRADAGAIFRDPYGTLPPPAQRYFDKTTVNHSSERAKHMSVGAGRLQGGISPPQEGSEWRILGHTYWNRAWGQSAFAFETYDPPGTFVPPHIHPTQDEFIHVIEGDLEVELDGKRHQAPAGSLVKMPRGIPHAYYNNSLRPTRCLFWVSPAGRLKELFDRLHDMTDLDEAVRVSAEHDVDFLPPEQ